MSALSSIWWTSSTPSRPHLRRVPFSNSTTGAHPSSTTPENLRDDGWVQILLKMLFASTDHQYKTSLQIASRQMGGATPRSHFLLTSTHHRASQVGSFRSYSLNATSVVTSWRAVFLYPRLRRHRPEWGHWLGIEVHFSPSKVLKEEKFT